MFERGLQICVITKVSSRYLGDGKHTNLVHILDVVIPKIMYLKKHLIFPGDFKQDEFLQKIICSSQIFLLKNFHFFKANVW